MTSLLLAQEKLFLYYRLNQNYCLSVARLVNFGEAYVFLVNSTYEISPKTSLKLLTWKIIFFMFTDIDSTSDTVAASKHFCELCLPNEIPNLYEAYKQIGILNTLWILSTVLLHGYLLIFSKCYARPCMSQARPISNSRSNFSWFLQSSNMDFWCNWFKLGTKYTHDLQRDSVWPA